MNEIFTKISSYMDSAGSPILIIIIITLIIIKISHVLIKLSITRVIKRNKNKKSYDEKREHTLIQVSSWSLNVFVIVFSTILILSELGIDIGPILAAAGIAGVALGFGAQYLVRDLLTGVFIILENQYRVGDFICLGTTCGTVENITLRITTIKDLEGTIHSIPNGEVKIASNLSKSTPLIKLDIGVSYDTDIEKLEKVVNKVGEDMLKDKEWKNKIKEKPYFVRINNFGDSAIEIRIGGETQTGEKWSVKGELMKRLKIAFDKNNILIPFPQRDIHIKK